MTELGRQFSEAPVTQPRVLVIDDEELVARATSRALRRLYDVITINDGADAIRWLAENAEVDVILCDLMMPGVDGWEVLSSLAVNDPRRRRFIFYTGSPSPWDLRRAHSLTGLPVLMKPASITRLRAAVSEALEID